MAAADTARRLIAAKGRSDGALRRPSMDQTVGAKPWTPVDADPVVDPLVASGLSVVVLDALTVARPGLSLHVDCSAVAFMDADVEPKVGDLLETAGDRYKVLEVDRLAPGPTTAMFTLQLKAS